MITREFEARIKRNAGQDVDVPVQVTLSYDAEVNPYAVQAVFDVGDGDDRVWLFGRELLTAGAISYVPLGRGDVKFRYFPQADALLMCVKSPDGHADVALPHGEIVASLRDTQELFDEASEDCTALIDGFLKEALGS